MTAIADLRTYLAETEDYRRIFDHLRFDQQSYMPDKATADRARQLGLMERQLRMRTGAPELGRLIAAVEATNPDEKTDFPTWAIAHVARRDHETELRRPVDQLAAFQRTASEGFLAWRDARKTSNWAAFAPWLRKIIDINLRLADAIGYAEHPMDALLSMYEPALSWRETQVLLDSVRDIVVPLNARRLEIVNSLKPDPMPVLPRDKVFAFVHDLAKNLGYDWDRGGLSISPHPFTSPSGANDVRFTLRDDVPFSDILKTAVHELGHALYEQGVFPDLWGTSAARGVMPYVHESQAKYWENIVGREPEFAVWAYDMLRLYLDDAPAGFGPEALHRAALYGPTSLIRTGSDELSFNLHIILRWEIECALLTGEIDVMDVPALWNERSLQYFGQKVPDDSVGCLQDPHWCHRYMGLFTSYTIGNVMSAQFWKTMETEGLSVNAALDARDVSPLLGWLRRNVHSVGRTYTLTELVTRVTGSPLSVDAFRAHLDRRYGGTGSAMR
ncbi:carboxypeptidase M32 [Rhizobium rhizogenes]|uniref:carboxypeptidase M32 n=1 Tax=Rhizobium rhizogenes TaxID=359 RepID=UPI001574D756|nr:carboxypeptidase M32 [Rhizobium rhizogenes]NTI78569.1 carboxypeptidase M32 [Rhizobium rhizogenes]